MEAVRLMRSANSFNYSSWVIFKCAVTGQTVMLLHRCLFFFRFLKASSEFGLFQVESVTPPACWFLLHTRV